MERVRRLKLILWTVVGLAAAVATARFLFGLGATTHLSDATPWGLWVGFDVMGGVALAAGGRRPRQRAGARRLPVTEFLRGFPLQEGARLA